jgi:hypothetical protein
MARYELKGWRQVMQAEVGNPYMPANPLKCHRHHIAIHAGEQEIGTQVTRVRSIAAILSFIGIIFRWLFLVFDHKIVRRFMSL